MKLLLYAIILLSMGCTQKKDNEYYMTVYSMARLIPIDSFHRTIVGYDSIQLIIRNGKLEGNFCYPNKWEFEKWRKDTVKIHDTIYIARDVYIDQR